MSSYQNVKIVNLVAGEDLTGDIYEILKLNTSGQVVKVAAVTDATIGILAEAPTEGAAGETVAVALIGGGGVAKVKAGATITAGDIVVPDSTSGRVAGVTGLGALVADQMGIGIAVDSAVDGDIMEIVLMPVAAPHSA